MALEFPGAFAAIGGIPLNIVPIRSGIGWIIAKNPHLAGGDGIGGTRSRRPGRMLYDGYWAGNRWVGTSAPAKVFPNLDDARLYLDEHADELYQGA